MKEKKGKRPGFRIFSKDERKKIVAHIEQGEITRQQAMQQYGIVEPDTLRSWILRYSANPENILEGIYQGREATSSLSHNNWRGLKFRISNGAPSRSFIVKKVG